MKKSILAAFAVSIIFLNITCTKHETKWLEPTQTSKPWTRWWWMGNAVDKKNVLRELNEFAHSGIGGVEITPIYGVKGEEYRSVKYLSPGFTEVIDFTASEAAKLGMGVDLPPGSGWRCGGPFVPEEKGLWNLKITKYKLKEGENWKIPDELTGIESIVFRSKNKSEILSGDEFKAKSDGTVYFVQRIKSGNKVKRAAEGGKGWAIDTFNEDVTNWYLNEFWKRLGIEEGKLRCFFHDSFEYTGDFTPNFLTEFKNRRGYDLNNYLYVLAGDCEDSDLIARVKSDYRETLADLVLESFIQPMTEWAHRHGSLNKNQAHGSPGNILDLYAACDIPETELFGRLKAGKPEIYIQKFASSAAHVTGKKLISSESFTWLDEHWTVTPSELIKATNRFFLAGINHMFFHGTCYSPEDAEWPGWLFYASTQLNNRNPIWREMPTLFKYIERTQNIMQQSKPMNDVLVYWPYYDVVASEGKLFNHIGVESHPDWFFKQPIAKVAEKLESYGYTYDFISDSQIQKCETDAGRIITEGQAEYKVIIIPETEFMPMKTMEQLEQLLADGGKIVFDKNLPQSVPGVFQKEKREGILNTLKSKVNKKHIGDAFTLLHENDILPEEDLAGNGFYHFKMALENDVYYLVFNTDTEEKEEWMQLNTDSKSYVFMNPMTGEITQPETNGKKLRLQLKPDEIMFIKCSEKKLSAESHNYFNREGESTRLDGAWKVQFIAGGPVFPKDIEMTQLAPWTQLGNINNERFCGTARYSLQFNWNGASTGVLDLGNVNDCVRVTVNDKSFGSLLGPHYSVDIDNLKKGDNLLQLEVTNIAANRIRDLDKRGVKWRKFHDINFVNIKYKKFDASDWHVREAGLLGPVRIFER